MLINHTPDRAQGNHAATAAGKTQLPVAAVTNALEAAVRLSQRVESLACRLVGEVPCSTSPAPSLSSFGGVLGNLSEHAGATEQIIHAAQQEIDRIESALP